MIPSLGTRIVCAVVYCILWVTLHAACFVAAILLIPGDALWPIILATAFGGAFIMGALEEGA